jgi:iron complex outermembrane receptor protein
MYALAVDIRKELVTLYIEAPYWISDQTIYFEAGTTYNGFQPVLETDIFDNLGSIGVRSNIWF